MSVASICSYALQARAFAVIGNSHDKKKWTMKFGIYVKSSLAGSARETDLDHQEDYCRAIVDARCGEVSFGVREPGTGSGSKLPALLRLIEQAQAGAFEVVVVDDINRLGCDIVEVRRVVEELAALGVTVCAGGRMPTLDHDAALAEITACRARISQAADDLASRLVAVGVAAPQASEMARDLVLPQGLEIARKRLRIYAEGHARRME